MEKHVWEKTGNKALIIGAAVGTIPDLDVLLTLLFSQLERLSIHRGYSQAIFFCLIAAIILAVLFKKIRWTRELEYVSLWIFSFFGLFTQVILDAFATYGTQLFLPFTNWRVSFDSINIVDPFYTVPLLIGVRFTVLLRNRSTARASWLNSFGIIISSVYLLFTLANKDYVEQIFKESLRTKI